MRQNIYIFFNFERSTFYEHKCTIINQCLGFLQHLRRQRFEHFLRHTEQGGGGSGAGGGGGGGGGGGSGGGGGGSGGGGFDGYRLISN